MLHIMADDDEVDVIQFEVDVNEQLLLDINQTEAVDLAMPLDDVSICAIDIASTVLQQTEFLLL